MASSGAAPAGVGLARLHRLGSRYGAVRGRLRGRQPAAGGRALCRRCGWPPMVRPDRLTRCEGLFALGVRQSQSSQPPSALLKDIQAAFVRSKPLGERAPATRSAYGGADIPVAGLIRPLANGQSLGVSQTTPAYMPWDRHFQCFRHSASQATSRSFRPTERGSSPVRRRRGAIGPGPKPGTRRRRLSHKR